MKKEFLKNSIIGDGKEKNFPKTRFEQMLYILKNNFGYLFVCGIISFIFCIPCFILLFVFSYQKNLIDMENISNVLSFFTTTFLYLIPCVSLSGVSLLYFIREISIGQQRGFNVYFKGMKNCFLLGLISFLIIGLSQFFMVFDVVFYSYSNYSNFVKSIFISIGVLQFIIVLIFMMFVICLSLNYQLKFKDLIKNSFVFSFKMFFKDFGIIILAILPWVGFLFSSGVRTIVYFNVLFLFGLNYSALIINQYSLYLFDKFVNIKLFKDAYKRGLFKEKKDEKNDYY